MTKNDFDFDTWFETVSNMLAEHGIDFTDKDSVRADYDAGKNCATMVDELADQFFGNDD